jgi:glycosyltransferase involved in cell wall biosynthesis
MPADKRLELPEPDVSVVIPFWNARNFLAEAAESVFAQSYTNWELILVDDASSDCSTAIAKQYCTRSPKKVHYVSHSGHRNLGASVARNLGVRHSRGRYIALLDADDVWLPNKLQQQVAIMERRADVDVVFGRSLYWHPNAVDVAAPKDYMPDYGIPFDGVIEPPTLLAHYALGKGNTPCPSCMLFRREVLSRIGGFEEAFAPPYGMYEDQAFLAKMFLTCAVYITQECWQKYRIHPESVSALTERDGYHDAAREFYLKWLREYLVQNDCTDARISRLLARALWRYQNPLLYRMLLPLLTASRLGGRALRRMSPQ